MLTIEDAKNLLVIINRALKASPQEGGLTDLMATYALVQKLNAIIKAETDGENIPAAD